MIFILKSIYYSINVKKKNIKISIKPSINMYAHVLCMSPLHLLRNLSKWISNLIITQESVSSRLVCESSDTHIKNNVDIFPEYRHIIDYIIKMNAIN